MGNLNVRKRESGKENALAREKRKLALLRGQGADWLAGETPSISTKIQGGGEKKGEEGLCSSKRG